MKYNENQDQEIKTIKERIIHLNLSDSDCERVSNLVGKHGITVSQLLENFIGDLVEGTYSNGSDERYRAEQWFERCWFGMFPRETLLKYLLENCIDIEEFLDIIEEYENYKANPQDYTDEVEEARDGEDMIYCEEKYHDYIDEFIDNHSDIDIDMKKEIELCKKWLFDFKKLINGSEI